MHETHSSAPLSNICSWHDGSTREATRHNRGSGMCRMCSNPFGWSRLIKRDEREIRRTFFISTHWHILVILSSSVRGSRYLWTLSRSSVIEPKSRNSTYHQTQHALLYSRCFSRPIISSKFKHPRLSHPVCLTQTQKPIWYISRVNDQWAGTCDQRRTIFHQLPVHIRHNKEGLSTHTHSLSHTHVLYSSQMNAHAVGGSVAGRQAPNKMVDNDAVPVYTIV